MKLKPVLIVAFALVLVALQCGLLHFFGGGAFSLSLAVPCIVYLGLHGGNVDGAIGSAGVGYVLDVMAGGPKGLMTFLAMVIFLISRLVGAAMDIRGRVGFAVLSGFGTLLLGVGALLLTRAVSPIEAAPGARLIPRMLLDALLTGLLSPLVGGVMRRIDGLFTKEEPGLLS